MHLMGDLFGRQFPVKRLPPRHGHGIVHKDLVGDIHPRGDGLADRQMPRMKEGAVAQIDKAVLFIGEAADGRPGHALGPHAGDGFGVPPHPDRHVVTADPRHGL